MIAGLSLLILVELRPNPQSSLAFVVSVVAVLAAFFGSISLFLPSHRDLALEPNTRSEGLQSRFDSKAAVAVAYSVAERVYVLGISLGFAGIALYLRQMVPGHIAFIVALAFSLIAALRLLVITLRKVKLDEKTIEFRQVWPVGRQVANVDSIVDVEQRATGILIHLGDSRSIYLDYRMQGLAEFIAVIAKRKRR